MIAWSSMNSMVGCEVDDCRFGDLHRGGVGTGIGRIGVDLPRALRDPRHRDNLLLVDGDPLRNWVWSDDPFADVVARIGGDERVDVRFDERARVEMLVAQPLVEPQLGQAWQEPARCICTPHVMHMGASMPAVEAEAEPVVQRGQAGRIDPRQPRIEARRINAPNIAYSAMANASPTRIATFCPLARMPPMISIGTTKGSAETMSPWSARGIKRSPPSEPRWRPRPRRRGGGNIRGRGPCLFSKLSDRRFVHLAARKPSGSPPSLRAVIRRLNAPAGHSSATGTAIVR